MYENDPTPASIPLTRECEWGCDWQIVSDSARVADLEAATHTIEAHASLPQRHQLRRLVDSYRQVIGPLPAHVLLLAVQQVLETPVGAVWPADETGLEASAA